MASAILDVDLHTLPELPHRHYWKKGTEWLGIAAERTVWNGSDADETVYHIDEQLECCYWTLYDGGTWEGYVKAATVEEAVNLLHMWCLMGIAAYTFRD